MRRIDREVSNTEELLEMINSFKVCRIAMRDGDDLYIVPLNFGYEYANSTLTLYFHSAQEGRKLSAIGRDGRTAFEMDGEHELVEAPSACGYGYKYKSVMGVGNASLVHDPQEKKHALSRLMKHQTGKEFQFTSEQVRAVAVFKITAISFSGKWRK